MHQSELTKLFTLRNEILAVTWAASATGVALVEVHDLENGHRQAVRNGIFQVVLQNGSKIVSSDLTAQGEVVTHVLKADPDSPKLGDRYGGMVLNLRCRHRVLALDIMWRAELRNGANYVHQRVTVTPHTSLESVDIMEVVMLDVEVHGSARLRPPWLTPKKDESPGGVAALGANVFAALEHPLARNGDGVASMTVGSITVDQLEHSSDVVLDVTAYVRHGQTMHPYVVNRHQVPGLRFTSAVVRCDGVAAVEAAGDRAHEAIVAAGIKLPSQVGSCSTWSLHLRYNANTGRSGYAVEDDAVIGVQYAANSAVVRCSHVMSTPITSTDPLEAYSTSHVLEHSPFSK